MDTDEEEYNVETILDHCSSPGGSVSTLSNYFFKNNDKISF